jgi:hypothetical protein
MPYRRFLSLRSPRLKSGTRGERRAKWKILSSTDLPALKKLKPGTGRFFLRRSNLPHTQFSVRSLRFNFWELIICASILGAGRPARPGAPRKISALDLRSSGRARGPAGRCWLKKVVARPVVDAKTVSGVKFKPASGGSTSCSCASDEHGWLPKRTKSPEWRTSIREVADGIVSTAPEFRGAPPPWALDLLQQPEPNFKEV